MRPPVLTAAPTQTPVSLEEAKKHLRVEPDDGDDDPLIEALIDAATSHLDGYSGILGRCLVTQTWTESGWPFDGCATLLRLAPVQSIESIKYWDQANVQQTIQPSNYELVADPLGTYVAFVSGYSVPSTYRRNDAWAISYVCGYGAPEDVPAAIKQAMLLMIGAWYHNREEISGEAKNLLPMGAQALLAPFRRLGL